MFKLCYVISVSLSYPTLGYLTYEILLSINITVPVFLFPLQQKILEFDKHELVISLHNILMYHLKVGLKCLGIQSSHCMIVERCVIMTM